MHVGCEISLEYNILLVGCRNITAAMTVQYIGVNWMITKVNLMPALDFNL